MGEGPREGRQADPSVCGRTAASRQQHDARARATQSPPDPPPRVVRQYRPWPPTAQGCARAGGGDPAPLPSSPSHTLLLQVLEDSDATSAAKDAAAGVLLSISWEPVLCGALATTAVVSALLDVVCSVWASGKLREAVLSTLQNLSVVDAARPLLMECGVPSPLISTFALCRSSAPCCTPPDY